MDSAREGSQSSQAEPSSVSTTLLERIRARQPEAWQRLVELYGPVVFLWCRQSGLLINDAADVVQQVWMAVAKNITKFHRQWPGDSFRGWLRAITRNEIRNRFHGLGPRPEGGTEARKRLEQVADRVPASAEQTSHTDSSLTLGVLERIRAQFEPRTWQAFWRMAVDGRSSAEVAAELGMTKHSVRQAKFRVARRLREELGELFD